MKKISFLFLFLFIFLTSSIFAFEVKNSNGDISNYFSIENSIVLIKNSDNFSNISMNYILNNSSVNKTYFFDYCQADNSSFCSSIDLSDNLSFSNNLTKIEIKIGNDIQNIFYDLEKPYFNLSSNSILDKKYLNLDFVYTDNSNKILKLDLYKLSKSGNKTYITNLKGITEYNFPVLSNEEFDLIFEVYDEAKNKFSYQKSFLIEDLNNPVLESYFMTIENNLYKFKFKITDDTNLLNYQIKQSDLVLSSQISGKLFETEVILPFNSGSFDIIITDRNNNVFSKRIDLSNSFSISTSDLYTNEKYFKISNSEIASCYLTKFDLKSKNEAFEKDSSTFKIDLDVSTNKFYPIEFYCQNSNLRVNYKLNFIYDNQSPSLSNISIEKKTNGDLRIDWNDSKDNFDEFKYILYRDEDKIYTGSKNYYIDSDVRYPNTYNYYLQIVDLAGNKIETKEVSEIPRKTFLNLNSNLQENLKVVDNIFNLNIQTDKNSNVSILVKNNNKIILEKNFENVPESLNVVLNFSDGINEVLINSRDFENNEKSLKYFVEYSELILVEDTVNSNLNNDVISENKNSVLNESVVKFESIDESGNFGFNFNYLIFIILLFLVSFSLIFAYHLGHLNPITDKIRRNLDNKDKNRKKDRHQSFKKKDHFFSFTSSIDKTLDRELVLVKQRRLLRQKELEEKKKRLEKQTSKENLSEFQKKKFEDISKSNNNLNFNQIQKKAIKNSKNNSNEDSFLDNIVFSVLHSGDLIRNKFNKYKEQKQKNINRKNDTFNQYLDKKNNEKSWSSSREYLLKTKLQKEEIKRQEEQIKEKAQNDILEKERQIDNERRLKEEQKQKQIEKQEKLNIDKTQAKESLDNYLFNRTKKKRWLFTEREVERDISSRK